MSKKNLMHYIAYILIFLGFIYVLVQLEKTNKIAVINAKNVLENYQGFKEAQDLYELKTQEMTSTFEKQTQAYESKLNELKILSNSLSKDQLVTKKKELSNLQAKTNELGRAIEKKAVEQEEKLLQGVYNKINDFVERYGKEHGIAVITGVTMSGNVLYASEKVDITNEVIEGLNKEYAEGVQK